MNLESRDGKRIEMPCYGHKCQICGWSPAKRNSNKICKDYRQDRPFVDLKPFIYKKTGQRVWRFPPICLERELEKKLRGG